MDTSIVGRSPLGVFSALLLSALLPIVAGICRSADAATPEATLQPHLTVETGAHAAFIRRLSVAANRGLVVTASDDKTARVWDITTGVLHQVLRPAVGAGEIGRLYGVAAHPTEDVVAVGGTTGKGAGEHRILLYSMSNGLLLQAFDARGGDIKKLAWSPDGSLLLAVYTGEHALRAFDRSGAMVYQQALAAPSYGLAVAADGTVAASSLDGQVVILMAKDGRVVARRSFRTRTEEPVGVAFSPDAARLVAGFRKPDQAPEVFEVASGRFLLKLERPKIETGSHRTVAWSEDGTQIAVSGSGYTARHGHAVFFHDAASGRIAAQQDVATDTVYDLVAMPGGQFAYASGDGSWGVVSRSSIALSVRATIADLKGPENLYVDANGRRIGWTNSWGRDAAAFDFSRRLVASSGAEAGRSHMYAPKTRRNMLDSPTWQDSAKPQVNGRAIDLGPAEVSRALAYFFGGADAVLGTSHRLLRISADGKVLWQVRNAGEVRSANVTGDNRMVVTGMSDGTLRWWRATDGALLLSLLATRDGRWVTWTPEGYFDASAGADRLVGWTVNRSDGPGADHFSLNRFRERFNRPDLIDRVLQTATPVAALDQTLTVSRTARTKPQGGTAQAPGAPSVAAASSAPLAPLSSLQFPPVIGPVDQGGPRAGQKGVMIPVSVRADGDVRLEIRVDGRPLPESSIELPAAAQGSQTAVATVPTPPPGSLVQVLARDRNGVSEPLGFTVETIPGAAGLLKPAAPVDQPAILRPTAALPSMAIAPPASTAMLSGRAGPGAAPGTPLQTRLYVLSIGISDYQRREYKLGLAAKDATDFADVMRQQTGRLYRDVQARTLTNGQATRLAIIANLQWLSDTVGPGDIGMLFLAGHGMNATSGEYYFLPYEGSHEQLAQSGLPEAAIRDTLSRMRGKALFFVDTCFGGNVVGNFSTASRELARMANDLAATENGVVVFASSSGKQLSEEQDSWGNGAFTKAVLAGLSGKADLTRTGRITFKGLDFYVSEEVRKLTEGRQTPVTISPVGVPDFAIARVDT